MLDRVEIKITPTNSFRGGVGVKVLIWYSLDALHMSPKYLTFYRLWTITVESIWVWRPGRLPVGRDPLNVILSGRRTSRLNVILSCRGTSRRWTHLGLTALNVEPQRSNAVKILASVEVCLPLETDAQDDPFMSRTFLAGVLAHFQGELSSDPLLWFWGDCSQILR